MINYPETRKVGNRVGCPLCEKTFADRSGFRYHYKTKHSEAIKKEPSIQDIAQLVVKELPILERLTPPKVEKGNLKPETWVLLLSDFHYGQIVRAIEVGGLSEYSPLIAKQRLETLAEVIIRLLEYYPNRPTELVIAMLGDMVDGSILRGNQQSNIEFGVVRQVIEGVELLSDFVLLLTGHFTKIRVYGVYGNHARLTPNPKSSHPKENFDLMLYHFIQQRFANMKGVSVDYTEAQHMIVEINGHNFWFEHGDTVRGWAGYPYYGADREKNNILSILAMFSEKAEYMCIGHHHRLAMFNNIIGNGSFPGGDLYSVGRLRRMDVPQQALFGVGENHGVVWLRPIRLASTRDLKLKIYK